MFETVRFARRIGEEREADHVAEVVALTVAARMENAYERHQHERLCTTLGFGADWISAVEACAPNAMAELDATDRAVQTGEVFLASQAPRSLDGRYFGVTPVATLTAQASPLLTWR